MFSSFQSSNSKMTPMKSSSPRCQRKQPSSPPPQTRFRARLKGASPLMSGLDERGVRRNKVSKTTGQKTIESSKTRRRPRIILRRSAPLTSGDSTAKPSPLLRRHQSAPLPMFNMHHDSVKSVEDMFLSMYEAAAYLREIGVAPPGIRPKALPERDVLQRVLPKLYTSF